MSLLGFLKVDDMDLQQMSCEAVDWIHVAHVSIQWLLAMNMM